MSEVEATGLQPYEKKSPAVRDQEKGMPDRLSDAICRKLIRVAFDYREKAYAPYSRFAVGAALLGAKNEIYGGCNVENAAYSPSICAERNAVAKAVSEGEREFLAMAIVGGKGKKVEEYCTPCGVCRQVLSEFVNPESFLIILARSEGEYLVYTLSDLFPFGFSKNNL